MKLAYADPPYIGCANKYPEKQEVDHAGYVKTVPLIQPPHIDLDNPANDNGISEFH